MRSKMLNAILRTAAFTGVLLTAGISQATDVYLQTQPFTKALPGLVDPVPMWGFALCTDGTFTDCALPGATDAPGPQINVDLAVDTALTIYLNNTLDTPVSIVIPGQAEDGGGAPVPFTDGRDRTRVRSFTHETSPGGTEMYTWSSLDSGT